MARSSSARWRPRQVRPHWRRGSHRGSSSRGMGRVYGHMPGLPPPRGPISGSLLEALGRQPHELIGFGVPPIAQPLADDDLQLALYLCYELHYRGLPGVDERWEWEPSLLTLRRALEHRFE